MEILLRKQTAEQNAKQIRLSNLVLDFESLWRFLKRLWGCSVLQQQLRKANHCVKTVWLSGLRRWLQAPVRKGVGSNPTAVTASRGDHWKRDTRAQRQHLRHRCRFGHPKHEGPERGNQTRRATDTYDWGNQCLKTRNHEKEHEEDEAEELHAPPPKKRPVAGKAGSTR